MGGTRRARGWLVAGVAVVVGVTAAACGGTPGSNNSTSTAAPATSAGATTAAAPAVQTDGFDKLGPINLTVWSYDNQDPGLEPVLKQLTKNFEAKYPNVHFKLIFKDFNSMTAIVNRALASDNGPDITEGNQGYQIDAAEVKAKLILPLDKYVQAYGWDKWWGPDTWQIFQWTDDGKTFGQGPKWGVAQTGQNVVVYYNKQKLQAAGIDPASLTDFDKFDAALATLRQKLPKSEPVIEFGNKEGYGTIHFLGGIQGAYGDAAPMRDWIYHRPGATFATDQNTKALDKLAAWVKAGYFNPDYNAIGYDDAAKFFAKGKGAFLYEGNWETAIVKAGLGDNAGVMNMPPGPSGKHVGIGATSGPWHISAKTKYPDVAAAWLNYVIGSQDAANLMFQQQQIPAVVSATPPTTDPFLGEVTSAWQQVVKDGGLMLYTDWASPSMYNTLAQNFQEVMAGKTSTANAAKAIQADWSKFDATLK
jgi:raffinose/stachyose/melibiose transport system substrate-binding protein